MMQAHPYDKFFDENTLSKAAPDYKNTIKQLKKSKNDLQKFLDEKRTKEAPMYLNEKIFFSPPSHRNSIQNDKGNVENLESQNFTQRRMTGRSVEGIHSYFIKEKSVEDREVSELT